MSRCLMHLARTWYCLRSPPSLLMGATGPHQQSPLQFMLDLTLRRKQPTASPPLPVATDATMDTSETAAAIFVSATRDPTEEDTEPSTQGAADSDVHFFCTGVGAMCAERHKSPSRIQMGGTWDEPDNQDRQHRTKHQKPTTPTKTTNKPEPRVRLKSVRV